MVIEATGNAAAVAEVLSPYVDRIVIANPKQVHMIAHAKVKTDTIDATVLATAIERHLGLINQINEALTVVEADIAVHALQDPTIRRLMTLPGLDVTVAASVAAAIGDIRRFSDPQKLVAYLGLNPSVRQSGEGPAYHGRITKQGRGHARGMLVEAAWAAVRSPGPLRAFHKRIASRRGKHIAAVATARKLAMIIWHMLSKDTDYIWARPALLARKFRSVELRAGLPTSHADAAPRSTTTSRPSAPKNDPASRRRKLPMQPQLPDGERGRKGRRLWKKPPNEKNGLFYNIRLHRLARRDVVPFDAMILRPGEYGV